MNRIKYIRTEIFKLQMSEFAAIAGVSQATVSKWENDIHEPNLSALTRIRDEAAKRGLSFEDSVFFEQRVAS